MKFFKTYNKGKLTLTGRAIGCGIGATVGGGMGALAGALNGSVTNAVGAAILNTNYDGYDVSEATKMGAVGECIVAASLGVILGGINGGFPNNRAQSLISSILAVAVIIGGNALGEAIFDDADMELDKLWAASILGYAVIGIPVVLTLALCILACQSLNASLSICTSGLDNDEESENNSSNSL